MAAGYPEMVFLHEFLFMVTGKIPPDLDALISLLDDPDAEAFRHVSEKISALGPLAVPSLESAWLNAFDPVMQERIEDLVHRIQFDNLYVKLREWACSEAKDLLTGYFLVSRFQYPDLREEVFRKQLDKIRRDIWLELNNKLTPLEKINVLNHFLFSIEKFTGLAHNPYSAESFYLNNVLESKAGTPLSLGLLYLLLAEELKLPLQGVDLPRHFILSYTNRHKEDHSFGLDSLEIMFYLNPFARGTVFTRKELNLYLKQLGVEPAEKHYMPCSNVKIIMRLLDEVKLAYLEAGNEEKADEIRKLREALEE